MRPFERTPLDTAQKLPRDVVVHPIEAITSPDGNTLLIIGEAPMDWRAYAFYDKSGARLSSPEMSISISTGMEFDDDGRPSICAHGETQVQWLPDGRLKWTEWSPYYTDLKMWGWDVEKHFERLHPLPENVRKRLDRPEFYKISDRWWDLMEKEKRVWRVYKTTILKRDGDSMIIDE